MVERRVTEVMREVVDLEKWPVVLVVPVLLRLPVLVVRH
jgi:hypothetical protein